MTSNRRDSKRLNAFPFRTMVCMCAGLLSFAPSHARAASAVDEGDVTQPKTATLTLADCEQTDSAPLVVRACTHMLKLPDMQPADRAHIHVLRGTGWAKEEDFSAAIEDFSAALKIDAANVDALRGRAHAHTKLGEHAAAVEDWSRLIALMPNNDEFFRSRGASNLAAGRHKQAFSDYDKSLELNPACIDAYIGRAAVHDALGERAQARSEFERGIAINRNYLPLYWERAQMAERWGEERMAIKDYEMVLKINGVYSHARKALDRLGILHPP